VKSPTEQTNRAEGSVNCRKIDEKVKIILKFDDIGV
jgi:hypothetical protein